MKKKLYIIFIFVFLITTFFMLTGCKNTDNKSNNNTELLKQSNNDGEEVFNWSDYLIEKYNLRLSIQSDIKVDASKEGDTVYLTVDYGTKGYDAFGTIVFDALKRIAKSDIYGGYDRTWTYNSFVEANKETYGYVALYTTYNDKGDNMSISFSPKGKTIVEVSIR